jgi:Rrf2 family iron-sulfur cluster assembly transcriptional regulator
MGSHADIRRRETATGDDMKLSAQEEYGLRCLIPYVAKLMRVLRQGKFVKSVRGQAGGYVLARTPENIPVAEVLDVLGGRLFQPAFCDQFPGLKRTCTHDIDCSIRSLWRAVQNAVDVALAGITLQDLLQQESSMNVRLSQLTPSSDFSGTVPVDN